MQAEDLAIIQTRDWINKVVVGCNFCPFAAREMNRGTVRYRVVPGHDVAKALESLLEECHHLDAQASTETSFVIFPEAFADFLHYLDFVALAEDLLIQQGYEGIYQVASFHPDYRFGDAPENDAANFTNRSPFAMLHLLREESLEKALEQYPGDPEDIPVRNVRFSREKGLAYMKMLRDACLQ